MTSRERILSAVAHTEPDRLPIDLGSTSSTSIQGVAYHKLRSHLGLVDKPIRTFDVLLQLAEVDPDVLDCIGSDAINGGQGYDEQWKEATLSDGWPCLIPSWVNIKRHGNEWIILNDEGDIVARRVEQGEGFSQTCWPLACDDWTQYLNDLPGQGRRICWRTVPEPIYHGPLDDAHLARMADHLKNLHETSDRAIVMQVGGALFAVAGGFRRLDNLLMDMAADRPSVEAFLDRLVESHLQRLGKLLPAYGRPVSYTHLTLPTN